MVHNLGPQPLTITADDVAHLLGALNMRGDSLADWARGGMDPLERRARRSIMRRAIAEEAFRGK
jgi:hypothetical protein